MEANSSDVVVTLLIPAQTAVVEAVVFLLKSTFKKTKWLNGNLNILLVTAGILALTLSICNAVLDLNKTQKIAGSIALITQAAIVMVAQVKNVAAEEAEDSVIHAHESAKDELDELERQEKAEDSVVRALESARNELNEIERQEQDEIKRQKPAEDSVVRTFESTAAAAK